MDSVDEIIDQHLNGELSDDGYQRLSGWLREEHQNVSQFATQCLIHSLLVDLIKQRHVQADALLRTVNLAGIVEFAKTQSAAGDLKTVGTPHSEAATKVSRWILTPKAWLTGSRYLLPALAVIVLIAVTFMIRGVLKSPPAAVAMLTQSANCRWNMPNRIILDGVLFHEGEEVRLAEGRALLTFSSGARILIEGPTVLAVESEISARLAEGKLTATVPRQAVGFAIATALARFVDLGTEFTLLGNSVDSLELQVFDGLVELQPATGNSVPNDAPLRISEGVAVKVDARSGSVNAVPYDAAKRMHID